MYLFCYDIFPKVEVLFLFSHDIVPRVETFFCLFYHDIVSKVEVLSLLSHDISHREHELSPDIYSTGEYQRIPSGATATQASLSFGRT